VIDDYSALRGLSAGDFNQRLEILSTSPGQQYISRQTPSTRFTGSGEFRAMNEPYGVMVTFMASGDDLPHPVEDKEKARKASMRTAAARSASADDTSADSDNKEPKIRIEVTDAKGNTVRRFSSPVHQGINRLAWDLTHDGVRPMPSTSPPEPDADLPAGPEVPPGEYTLTLSLEDGSQNPFEVSTPVEVMADPRLTITPAQRQANYQAMLDLQSLQESAVNAVELIVRTRADIKTVETLVGQQENAAGNQTLQALLKQAGELKKGLDQLEARFRVAPETKGVVYDDDRAINQVGLAQFYIGSSLDAETEAATVYKELARKNVDAANAELAAFFVEQVNPFQAAVDAAGISLFARSP
jgi:hypothetical protein